MISFYRLRHRYPTLQYFINFLIDSNDVFKFFTRRELYEMMKVHKGKKIDEKFSLLED